MVAKLWATRGACIVKAGPYARRYTVVVPGGRGGGTGGLQDGGYTSRGLIVSTISKHEEAGEVVLTRGTASNPSRGP